jgi:hypothetical protein
VISPTTASCRAIDIGSLALLPRAPEIAPAGVQARGTRIIFPLSLYPPLNTAHLITQELDNDSPLHIHGHKIAVRLVLLLVLGSSPMVEGIPAFFAAGKYGFALNVLMSVVLAISTIATYELFCVSSRPQGLRRVLLGAFEWYREVLSGALIALVGFAFWIWPVL